MEAKPVEIKFGTDGWRGVMAREFTFANLRRAAQAVADYVKALPAKERGKGLVVVGYDRRFMSEEFAEDVARVMQGNGLKAVLLAEPMPTPAVSWLTVKEKAFGLMITASHNPAGFNGLKLKVAGRAANEETTRAVESHLDHNAPARDGAPPRKSYRKEYLAWLRSRVATAPLSGIKRPVVVDYMYGAAAGLFEELARLPKLVTIHDRRDPLFGGLHPEPIEKYLKELSERVREEKALVGLAFDGDADRLGVVDDQGCYLTPCQVFPMLLEYLIAHRGVKGKIVQSVSLGRLSGRIAKAHGLPFEELPVGFKHVGEALARDEAAIGGEESGGYAWKGGQPERDGMLTGLLFLEMLLKTKKTPSQWWAEIEAKYGKSCFVRADFPVHKPIPDKTLWTEKFKKRLPKKIIDMPIRQVLDFDGLKVILEDESWLLLRPSGTEPLIRTYAESDTPKRTQGLLDVARRWIGA